jgi:hypothetical protein
MDFSVVIKIKDSGKRGEMLFCWVLIIYSQIINDSFV